MGAGEDRGAQAVTTLTTKQAATYIGKSASWLNKSRMSGTGPVYLKLGGSVRYLPADLDAWLDAARRTAVYDFANNAQVAHNPVCKPAISR